MTDRETKSELPEELPPGLPVPEDDGVAGHLPGMHLSSVALRSTSGNVVDLSALAGVGVAYCFPMIGRRVDSKGLIPCVSARQERRRSRAMAIRSLLD